MTDDQIKIGDLVWAYNMEPDRAREDMKQRGIVVRSYHFIDEAHWLVELIDAPCRQVLAHRAGWLAPRSE